MIGAAKPIVGIDMIHDLLQPQHLLVILGIALFMFGPTKLPELGKGLGEGIRGFKNALNAGATGTDSEKV
jgi:sec-independent protein translocase protein TatA